MKRLKSPLATFLLAAAAVLAAPAMAQDIGYSSSWPLTLPHDTFFGMAAGVATDSKGHVFVYTRNTDPILVLGGSRAFAHGGSSLYEFDAGGKFVRQIGKQVYGFLAAQQVRVDPHDNIWVVDRYSSMVIKLNPQERRIESLNLVGISLILLTLFLTFRIAAPWTAQWQDMPRALLILVNVLFALAVSGIRASNLRTHNGIQAIGRLGLHCPGTELR